MKTRTVPDEVRENALQTIERFNQRKLAKTGSCYLARFQGKYLYLDREDLDNITPICRLKYKGAGNPWGFAIYKFSLDCHDPKESWFPGFELADGPVEGALKAGMEAYSREKSLHANRLPASSHNAGRQFESAS